MSMCSVQTRSSCEVNSYGCSQEQVGSALTSLFMGDPLASLSGLIIAEQEEWSSVVLWQHDEGADVFMLGA